jgi:hypothetical protein
VPRDQLVGGILPEAAAKWHRSGLFFAAEVPWYVAFFREDFLYPRLSQAAANGRRITIEAPQGQLQLLSGKAESHLSSGGYIHYATAVFVTVIPP